MKVKTLFENPNLVFNVLADTHIDVKHPLPELPKFFLKQALRDSENFERLPDALVIVGDTTSRGNDKNWNMARPCFAKYTPAKNLLLALGNHDTWHDDSYDAAIKEYRSAFCDICGFALDKLYFSKEIGGYKFIFLASEYDGGCEANITDEQVDWLKNELDSAEKTGKPVFVFNHQAINGTHGLPRTFSADEHDKDPMDGGIGVKSDEIKALLENYPRAFYFSGHSHMALSGNEWYKKEGYCTLEKDGNLTLLNVPSLACGNHHGKIKDMGIGFVVEVYNDRVLIRPRNFSHHKEYKKFIAENDRNYWEIKL